MGNEAADKAARQAASQDPTEQPLRCTDIKQYLQNAIWSIWQIDWDTNTTQLQTLKPDVRSAEEGGRQLTRRERAKQT
jgi:hypothetical protein